MHDERHNASPLNNDSIDRLWRKMEQDGSQILSVERQEDNVQGVYFRVIYQYWGLDDSNGQVFVGIGPKPAMAMIDAHGQAVAVRRGQV